MRTLFALLLTTPAWATNPTVVTDAEAPVLTAPSGKAQIQHLAQGHNAYLGRLTLAAGAAVPEHRDQSEEIIHVLAGTGTLTVDGKKYAVGPGTTIYMPANAKVSYQNGPQPFVGLQVFAGVESAAKYTQWKPAK